ncbi:MAG TPA: hypothetical protein VI756_04965 [Blastocatellia bacterium]
MTITVADDQNRTLLEIFPNAGTISRFTENSADVVKCEEAMTVALEQVQKLIANWGKE